MAQNPQRKTDHLLKGRVSIPHARYFITICTQDRQTGLLDPVLAEAIRDTWRRQHRDGDYVFHCGTVMPEHIHWLCTLGTRLALPQVISKFKSLAKIPQTWQRNYYDHRLRADDAQEPFSKYIFLNPYRRKLITPEQEWPWWTRHRDYHPEFITHLKDGKYPPAEWLEQSVPIEKLVADDAAVESEPSQRLRKQSPPQS